MYFVKWWKKRGRELEEKGQSSRGRGQNCCWEGSPLPLKLPFVNPLPSSVWAIVLQPSIENQAPQLIIYSSFEVTRTISWNLGLGANYLPKHLAKYLCVFVIGKFHFLKFFLNRAHLFQVPFQLPSHDTLLPAYTEETATLSHGSDPPTSSVTLKA